METINTQFVAALSASRYTSPQDIEAIAKLADKIGTMDRETYLALRNHWKAQYRTLAAEIRLLKPQRKGGTPEASNAIYLCRVKRDDARAHMVLRHALKEVARRSVEARKVPAL